MSKLTFHSNQIHTSMKNGKRVTRRNTVKVFGNKGYKELEIVPSGPGAKKKSKKTKKALTKKEISNIHKGIFMRKLFHKFLPSSA